MVIGNLPNGWTWVTIGGISTAQSGAGFPKTLQGKASGDYPLAKVSDITDAVKTNSGIISRANNYLSVAEAKKLGAKVFPEGTTLFAKIGEAVGLNRRALSTLPILADNNVMGLIPNKNSVAAKFLYYFMQTIDLYEYSQATTVPSVRKGDVEQIAFPLPPVLEQERIVAKIEELFTQLEAGTATLKRVQAGLKRYKASVLKAACEGRLLNGEGRMGNDGELPDGWRWTTVGEIGEISGGLTKNSKRDVLPKKLPYLRVANVYANELRLDDVSEIGIEENEIQRTLLKDGDLLVVEGNGSADQIGRVALWNGNISPCLHQNHIIKVRFEPKEVAEYVLYWLLSDGGREQITRVASSTSGLYTLSLSKVANLKVPLPPLAEQRRIVAEVERRLSVAQEVESVVAASVARASRLRQSVLKSAFEGRLG